ncbi:uncharacterized protein LOC143429310 [Xylocopa sonorina]|uniref:uncharacterized protein LOC143429310 n=1 Tax=Xylocopa sonorina TaxID=1818115 RepID=UPI00403AFE8A
MMFLLSRMPPGCCLMLAVVATSLVTSMPAPPSKRSTEDASDARSGFSSVPKILEIQLPLKIASKDDLVAWAKYVMGLMASKINITLTTVKEAPSKSSGSVRVPDNARQPQNTRNSAFKHFEDTRPINNVRHFGNVNNLESSRYAENIRNLGHSANFDRFRVPANDGRSENIRNSLRNGNIQLPKEKVLPNQQLPTISINGITTSGLFNNRQLYPTFGNIEISDTTIPSPLEIAANINVARSKIKLTEQPFVPQFPDFVPITDTDIDSIFRNRSGITPPSRNYLPVPTTTDNIKFPNDPFVTRYFFDGVERNISSNVDVHPSEIALTTRNPLFFGEDLPLPVKSVDLLSQQRNTSSIKPLFNVPFQAVVTFTRGEPVEVTTSRNEGSKYFTVATRDPLDQFPPYFDTNYTLSNEPGTQINVVFDDGSRVTEVRNDTRKEERKKQEKKKGGSKRQKSQKQKSDTRQPSPIGEFLKTFVAVRRNNTPSADLTPPPLNQQVSSTTQRVPARQRVPPPQRTQLYPPPKPPSTLRQGRRNQTSLAQQLEDDDEGGNSMEGSSSNESNKSNEGDKLGNVQGSDESSSSESDYDDSDEEGGGFVKALIDLLQLAAPILDDLSDPESDADIGDVLAAAVPLLEELSEGDGETEGFDIPALLLPILLQISGGMDGQRDSAAILTPLLQLSAPLVGPLSGPLLVPLSRQSSNPPGEGGSSSGDIIKVLLEPLLQPVGPGKMTVLSNLIAGVISSLSKNSAPGGKSDITSLVKAVVAGSIAGTSAGSSGQKDSYGAPTGYAATPYGNPSDNQNPFLVIGSSVKTVVDAALNLVTSLVNAFTGILGASSSSSNEPAPYGPPPTTYTRRPSYMVPPSDSVSITTRGPERLKA